MKKEIREKGRKRGIGRPRTKTPVCVGVEQKKDRDALFSVHPAYCCLVCCRGMKAEVEGSYRGAWNATKRVEPALELDAAKTESKESAAAETLFSPFRPFPLTSFFFLLSFVHRFQKNVTQAVKLKTKKRPKKLTPSDKKHVGATYPALPPPPPAFTILKAGASN